MVRPELVRRKLSHLHGYLEELEAFRGISAEEYTRKGGPRRSVERLLQLVVEVAVDVNVHLVTELTGTPPGDYRASFSEAASCGVLPRELADRLAPSAGLRNVIVHDYAAVDDERVRGAVPLALDGFRSYVGVVERWLEQHEGEG